MNREDIQILVADKRPVHGIFRRIHIDRDIIVAQICGKQTVHTVDKLSDIVQGILVHRVICILCKIIGNSKQVIIRCADVYFHMHISGNHLAGIFVQLEGTGSISFIQVCIAVDQPAQCLNKCKRKFFKLF